MSPEAHRPGAPAASRLFSQGSWPEASRIAAVLREETAGGALLLFATVLALAWANSPWTSAYTSLRDARLGPGGLQLHLTAREWAADGLLAVFFFVAGLELKREFVAGDLRDPRRAALPVAAAIGGMALPALVFVLVNRGTGGGTLRGWAIATATDIAFALAVLAVISSHLPAALRTFLLTLAVVDDLVAIMIIAVFFPSGLTLRPLLLALLPLVAFGVLVQRRVRAWWLLLPLAAATWALVHASGVHATVAGVLLGFTVPVVRSRRAAGAVADRAAGEDAGPGLAEHFEHRCRPLSAGIAVPVFAFFSAGVTVGGLSGLGDALGSSIAVGIVAGLVLGKPIGICLATYLVARLTKAELDENLSWIDVLGLGLLAGMGFTVSLLIGELAYGSGSERVEQVKVGVLAGSLLAAAAATVVLRLRNRTYRLVHEEETADRNSDGIPDAHQPVDPNRSVDPSPPVDPS